MAFPKPGPAIGKRKRDGAESDVSTARTLHITVGSYERVLHAFTASISTAGKETEDQPSASFEDVFLLNSHASSVRCLALSPASASKRILATGGSDERINIYQLSTSAPQAVIPPHKKSNATGKLKVAQSLPPRSCELGSLAHHSSTVTALTFPTHSKLLSASLDNTISIARTRDWNLLTTLKAPLPKTAGRPSGDTYAPGDVPAGVADVAVHPSQRLAISVGIGERCMRLWNLVSGKRAGVLVFDKALLEAVGEGRGPGSKGLGLRGGEGKRVCWRDDGEEFAVAFERGVLIFGLDCKVRARLMLGVREKVGQLRYLERQEEQEAEKRSVLVVSTESGQVQFYSTNTGATPAEPTKEDSAADKADKKPASPIPTIQVVAQLRPLPDSGARSRVKDFQILSLGPPSAKGGNGQSYAIVTGSSDGAVRIWSVSWDDVTGKALPISRTNGTSKKDDQSKTKEVGTLLGTYETGKRITCLVAFVMDDAPAASESHGEDTEGAQIQDLPGKGTVNGDVSSEDDSEDWEGLDD